MKKVLLLFSFFCTIQFGIAQDLGIYNLEVLNDTYVPLTNGTLLEYEDAPAPWDDFDLNVPLGFDFKIFTFDCDSLYIESVELFYNSEESYDNYYYENTGAFFVPLFSDYIDRGNDVSLSPLRYITEGDPGSQIFKFEVANAGFANEEFPYNSFVNYQIWLYEADLSIEFRYGPSNIEDYDIAFEDVGGPIVTLVDSLQSITMDVIDYYFLVGDPAAPEIVAGGATSDPYYETLNLTAVPDSGTVYRFYISDVAVQELPSDIKMAIVQNPIEEELIFEITNQELFGQKASASIFDLHGKLLYRKNIQMEQINTLAPYHLVPGSYFLNIETEQGQRTMKFLKSE